MKTFLIIIVLVTITLQLKSQPFHVVTDWIQRELYPCQNDVVVKYVQPQTINQCDENPWILVYEDNFNDLDLSKWDVISGVNRDETFENQKSYLKTENVYTENGRLKINCKREYLPNQGFSLWIPENNRTETFYSDFDFTTGEIWSKSKFTFGKIEARIKIPMGKGYWPAFWMFGSDPVYSEIDVFEFWDNDSHDMNMTIHHDYDGDGIRKYCGGDYNGPDFSADFHVFTLVWEKNKIEWWVDENLIRTVNRNTNLLGQDIGCILQRNQMYIKNTIYPTDPMALIFDVVMLSKPDKKPDSSTLFPQQMEIDWVKYYQRVPCQDIVITNQSQYPVSNDIYNVIAGNSVNISNTFTIGSGQQLKIIANNGFKLGAGFKVNSGATFIAKIDNAIGN